MGLRSFVTGRRGQALVEFALTVPLLLLIVLGLFDLARAVWYSETLAFATSEGARYAAVHRSELGACGATDATTVKNTVQRNAIGLNPDPTVTVSCPNGTDPGRSVNVSATMVFTPATSRYFLNGALEITLSGGMTATMWQ